MKNPNPGRGNKASMVVMIIQVFVFICLKRSWSVNVMADSLAKQGVYGINPFIASII